MPPRLINCISEFNYSLRNKDTGFAVDCCILLWSLMDLFCCFRYIPLYRTIAPFSTESDHSPCSGLDPGSFPSLSSCDEAGKSVSSSLFRCKFGSADAAAKVSSIIFLSVLFFN